MVSKSALCNMFEDILDIKIPLDGKTLEAIANKIEKNLSQQWLAAGMFNQQYMSNEACRLFEELSGKNYKKFDIRVALVDSNGSQHIKVIIGQKNG